MIWFRDSGLETIYPHLIISGAVAAGWLVYHFRARIAQSWPIANGTIESTTVREEGFGHNKRTIAEVNYSYSVGGEYYSGVHRVGGERDFDSFPKGVHVLVHYKPSDHATSFLDRRQIQARRKGEMEPPFVDMTQPPAIRFDSRNHATR